MPRPERVFASFGLFVLLFVFASRFPTLARADDWVATLNESTAPSRMVGVDKKNRAFYFFEKKSPLRLRYSYPCVTGQAPGDKTKINDLRTPEGVYFVDYKIANGLDFREYGGVAYTLNYPNPVDRLRGKTGHGIWIHSKGFELAPTRGCVAIGLKDIAEVGPLLAPGTAVVLAEELRQPDGGDNETLKKLKERMREWSAAWSSRSSELFDYYDSDAYSRATENFDAFRLNKERLFKILSFIKIFNREINALEGPGYWVTWAEQLYTASNLSTEGVRRLYWQKGEDGDFRIVGMEWIPRDVGMRAELKEGKLVAEGPVSSATDAASEAPVAPRLDMPEQPWEKAAASKEEKLGGLFSGLNISADKLVAVSEPLVPKKQSRTIQPDEIEWGKGKKMTEESSEPVRKPAPQLILPGIGKKPVVPEKPTETRAPEPKKPAVVPSAPAQIEKPVEPAKPAPEKPKPEIVLTEKELAAKYDAWAKAYKERDAALLEFYDRKNFNRIPETRDGRHPSFATVNGILNADLKSPWLFVVMNEPRIEAKGAAGKTVADMLIVGPKGARKGSQTLLWQKNEKGEIGIVGSQFLPSNADKGSQ
ncbi:MAG: L,D-transpeptidase family protein, partial [Desulfovibrio sp.]|nr:L,D-transpeptidase family protein [Desulfovibrio sp.]